MARRRRRARNSYSDRDFGGVNSFEEADDVDPMANVANLVDAMLAFACGLLIAVTTYWNIDLPDAAKVVEQEKLKQVEDVNIKEDELKADGSAYSERGVVYEDENGDLWLLEENGD